MDSGSHLVVGKMASMSMNIRVFSARTARVSPFKTQANCEALSKSRQVNFTFLAPTTSAFSKSAYCHGSGVSLSIKFWSVTVRVGCCSPRTKMSRNGLLLQGVVAHGSRQQQRFSRTLAPTARAMIVTALLLTEFNNPAPTPTASLISNAFQN